MTAGSEPNYTVTHFPLSFFFLTVHWPLPSSGNVLNDAHQTKRKIHQPWIYFPHQTFRDMKYKKNMKCKKNEIKQVVGALGLVTVGTVILTDRSLKA